MFLCEILTEQQQALPQPVVPVQPAPQVIPVQQVSTPQQQKISQADLGYGDEYDPELDSEEVVEEIPPFQEILPMKRYYLIQKLNDFKLRLDSLNISNEDFNTILKFMNNLSYNSLLSLSSGILPVVEDQIARLTNDIQK